MRSIHRPEHVRDLERESERQAGEGRGNNLRYALIAGAVALVILSFWCAMQVASLLSGHWLPVSNGLVSTPKALISLPKHLLTPAAGYPHVLRHLIAPGWLFLPVLIAFVAVEIRYGKRVWQWWQVRHQIDRGGTEWATERHLKIITDGKDSSDAGVILGVSQKGKPIHLQPESHALVVAGTRSGKTAGLCIPALLTFPGPIIATSVKNDLVDRTIKFRKQLGKVYVFDPVGATGMPEKEIAGWSPLESSREWREAQRTASSLIDVSMSKKGVSSTGNMEFFKSMARQTLPVLLYAAAVMDEDMRRVVRWLHRITDTQTHAEVQAILEWKQNSRAHDAWVGFVTKEPKIRGDIAATIASALVSYEDEKVEQNATHCEISPESFFDGKANTIYVCAPMAEQSRLEPVFVAMIQSLLLWVTEQRGPLETPTLIVLDEAANIAALPMLPEILSTIGGYNVQIITSWQDFSQIKFRYGDQYHTILNNSRGKLVLPGVADPETIDYFSKVTGETIERQVSVSRTDKHSRQLSFGEGRRSLLTPATIREQQVGEAILVYGHLPPAKISLRLWFEDRQLTALSEGKTPPPAKEVVAKKRVLGVIKQIAGAIIKHREAKKARASVPPIQEALPETKPQPLETEPQLQEADPQPPQFHHSV